MNVEPLSPTRCQLSVVATLYNDRDVVRPLVEEIRRAVVPMGITYEIILVDDGSEPGTRAELAAVCAEMHDVRGILLARNFGQQVAVSAGIGEAGGDAVVVMDGDLQNPPDEIPRLHAKLEEGHDIVYTVSTVRDTALAAFTSWLFWVVMARLFGVRIVTNQLMLRIMSRAFVERFRRYPELNRVVAGITHDIGMRQATLEVENRKRTVGKSHYNVLRRLELMLDLVINMSNRPLDYLIYAGSLTFVVTVVYSALHLFRYMFEDVPPGFTSVILAVCVFGSATVAMLGIIGRYLSNIYVEVKRRPLYHVQERLGFE